MNTNSEIITNNDKNENLVSEEYSAKEESSKKPKVINVLIFIACILISFAIWCYANYKIDPIVERDLYVEFNLIGGAANEYITPVYHCIKFYGPESSFKNVNDNTISFKVYRSAFNEYGQEITVKLKYDNENYHTHTPEVKLTLKVRTENNINDQNTDK